MEKIWKRIDTWLAKHAPELLAELQDGASEAEIVAAEAALGVEFPTDFRASLKIHNGQRHPEGMRGKDYGLLEGCPLLPLKTIVSYWKTMEELRAAGDFEGQEASARGPVAPVWWHPKWIPITHDFNSDYQCLDLAPEPGGSVGQIIQFWHDWENRKVLSSGFRKWLEEFASALEAGEYGLTERGSLKSEEED